MPAFRASVIDLAAASQGDGAFEGVMRRTLVQAELGAVLPEGAPGPTAAGLTLVGRLGVEIQVKAMVR